MPPGRVPGLSAKKPAQTLPRESRAGFPVSRHAPADVSRSSPHSGRLKRKFVQAPQVCPWRFGAALPNCPARPGLTIGNAVAAITSEVPLQRSIRRPCAATGDLLKIPLQGQLGNSGCAETHTLVYTSLLFLPLFFIALRQNPETVARGNGVRLNSFMRAVK